MDTTRPPFTLSTLLALDDEIFKALLVAFCIMRKGKNLILNEVKKNYARITSYNVCYTKLLRVNELFEAKKISVQMIGGFPNDTGEKVGYCDSNFYYFLPSKIYGEVVKFYAAQNETFPLTKIRLFRQLSSEGLIVSDKGVNTLQKRFGAIKGKYLCFPKAIFDGEKAA